MGWSRRVRPQRRPREWWRGWHCRSQRNQTAGGTTGTSAIANAYGGNGGGGVGVGYSGGAGGDAGAVASTTSNYSANAISNIAATATGGNGGFGDLGAAGGNGGAASIINDDPVGGSSNSISLTQNAFGGNSGGSNGNNSGGIAGSATSFLIADAPGQVSFTAQINAEGGNGGNSENAIASSGASATALANVNSDGTLYIAAVANDSIPGLYSTGGNVTSGSTGTGGAGGAASASAAAITGSTSLASAISEAWGGLGGSVSNGVLGSGGAGGNASSGAMLPPMALSFPPPLQPRAKGRAAKAPAFSAGPVASPPSPARFPDLPCAHGNDHLRQRLRRRGGCRNQWRNRRKRSLGDSHQCGQWNDQRSADSGSICLGGEGGAGVNGFVGVAGSGTSNLAATARKRRHP